MGRKKKDSVNVSALVTKMDELSADEKAAIQDALVFSRIAKDEENFERPHKWMEGLSDFSSTVLRKAFARTVALGCVVTDHQAFEDFKSMMLERLEPRPWGNRTVESLVDSIVGLWIFCRDPHTIQNSMEQELKLRMAIIKGYQKSSWNDEDPEFPEVFKGIEGLEKAVEAMKEKAPWTGHNIRLFLDNVVQTVYEFPVMPNRSNIQRFNSAIMHELNPEADEE